MATTTTYLVTLPRSGTHLVDRIMSRVANTLSVPYTKSFCNEFPSTDNERLVKSHDVRNQICPEKSPKCTQFIVLHRGDKIEQSDAMMRFFHKNKTNTSGAYLASYITSLSIYLDEFTSKWCDDNDHAENVHIFKYNQLLQDTSTTLLSMALIVFPEFSESIIRDAVQSAIQSEEGGIVRRNTMNPILYSSTLYYLDLKTHAYAHDYPVPESIISLVPLFNDMTDDVYHGIWRRYPFMQRMIPEHASACTRSIPLWTPSLIFSGDCDIAPIVNEVLKVYPHASHASIWLIPNGTTVQKYVDCRKKMSMSPRRIISLLSGHGSVSIGNETIMCVIGAHIFTNHVPFGISNTEENTPLVVLVLDYYCDICACQPTRERAVIQNQFDDVYDIEMHEWGLQFYPNYFSSVDR